jgi:cytochrome d ubiquinol oxidase subunit I
VDWLAIVFNPSFPLRYAHMVTGCYLTTAFAVAGMSAWMLLRHPHDVPEAKLAGARRSLSMALWFAVVVTPIQIFIGDMHGLGVLKYQPTKLAAIEGNWDRQANMPLRLFAIPDEQAETNHYEIAIPKIGSWVLTHAFEGVVPGLKDVPRDQRPPVWPVFFSFRIMVGIGFAMLGLGLWSLYLRHKGTLYTDRLFLTAATAMTPSGFGAVLFGWFTAEIGRQPYVVYGHLRTADAVSPVTTGAVTFSLAVFVVVYAIVFGFGSYYLAKLLRKGPDPVDDFAGVDEVTKKPKRPFSLPDEKLEGKPA